MHKKIIVGVGCIAAVTLVVSLAVFGSHHLLQTNAASSTCSQQGAVHTATIKDNKVQPSHISGQRCDVMEIVNLDAVTREIGFGNHDHHVPYDGVSERLLTQNQSLTVTLNQTGEYHFHDHFHDEVTATFTVVR
jgi:plastocyanin